MNTQQSVQHQHRPGLFALGVLCVALAACSGKPATEAAADPAAAAAPPPGEGLAQVVAGEHRSAANKARDAHRHPVETLTFFGIHPDSTVVELWPFGGWYTEILAPYLRERGVYYAAAMDPASTDANDQRYNASLNEMLAAHPELYSNVKLSVLAPGKYEIAPAGSADLVLSFRNIHNWVWAGIDKDVYAAAFAALKPGGVLGIVEHRHADPNYEPRQPGQAYVGEEWAIAQIEAAGFKLDERSGINNNPKDTKDHPRGVWTLPPTYALGDQDRAKYEAIGESDRFTLRFIKPAPAAAP
jgi:predicted methyltransferase